MTTLAENIETIVTRRADGKLGDYLGSTANIFGACRIDGVVYHVKRSIDVDAKYRWGIKNINDNTVAFTDDDYLCYASDFVPMTDDLKIEWNQMRAD